MKRSLVILFFIFLQFLLYGQPVRTWTSKNGHSFQGTFIRMDGPFIFLRGTDGKEVQVPLQALDEATLEIAQEAQKLAEKDAPVFTHQNRYLRFALYPKTTWMEIEFLEGTRVVNDETYELNFSFAETGEEIKWKGINIKEMAGPPEKGRDNVVMRLLMENGVTLKFTVDVDDKDEINFSYEAEEIPEGLPRLALHTSIKFPKLLEYDMEKKSYKGPLSSGGVFFKDLPGFFEGYEIHVETTDEEDLKIPYHEKQSKGIGAAEFTVKAPGKKDFILKAPGDGETGKLYVWFYGGKEPFQGYSLRAQVPGKDQLHAGPFTIRLK